MALVKATLQAAISTALSTTRSGSFTINQYCDAVASDIANAIDTYIKAAVVTVPLGVAVQTVPATGTGATTAPGIGTLS